ncbi:MAG: antibiotic biosynthesis monooxygenase family protein [Streptomycetales bacterium]
MVRMVIRMWRGWVARDNADAYQDYMNEVALEGYAGVPGNCGVYMLRRPDGDREGFCMVTLWESYDAIAAFAGADPERAVFYPRDDEFLVERETTARHYEVYNRV